MNYYLLFILSNFILFNSFIYNKQIYRLCTNKQTYKMCTNDNKDIFYNFGTNPRLEYPNENGQLTWYPIGFTQEFSKEPKQITIQNNNYVVWKDDTSFYALKNGYPFQNKIFYTYNNSKSCACNNISKSCNTDSCSCNNISKSCNTDSCSCNNISKSCNTDSCLHNNKTCSCSCNTDSCSCNTDSCSCNTDSCSCNTDSCSCNNISKSCNTDSCSCNNKTCSCNTDSCSCNNISKSCNTDSCSCNNISKSCNTDSCSCNNISKSCNTDSCLHNNISKSCNTDSCSCNNISKSCNTESCSCNNISKSCNTESCLHNNKTCSCNNISKSCNNKNDSQNNIQNILFYKVVEKADIVYLNTIPLTNQYDTKLINESAIFIEPEYLDKNKIVVYLYENIDINYNAKYVTVNNLDLCHTFGNIKIPNPKYNSKIEKIDDCEFHYKITYNYYTDNNVKIENEYLLPHTTISRVYFSGFNSTVISYALPITKSKTKLFVKYYSSYNNSNCIIHFLGDKFIKNLIYTMFKQDILFIGYDKSYNSIFSNHYKLNYKKYYL